jgi:glyoxylate reductase
MARCFVTRELPGPALDRLRARHDVEVWSERLPPSAEQLADRAGDAAGLLSLVTDRVAAASARGIPVGNTPDVLTDATADLAFALLLAAARKLPEAIAAARDGDWLTWEPGQHLGAAVNGATLGIIGLGRIGRAVARRASGFDMTVLHTGSGDGATSLETLLERSDFVSLHCPLTPATHHLIDAAALSSMRSSAILINTARGPIVDHDALRTALISGEIAGAALDVTDPEPLPADHPLLEAPNLIVAPHIGSATRVAREQMAELAVDNLLAGLDGRPMPHQVNEPR